MKRTVNTLLLALAVFAMTGAAPAAAIQAVASSRSYATPFCAYSAATANVIAQTTETTYGSRIKELSGAVPVNLGEQSLVFTTRFSPALFDGTSQAFDYLKAQVLKLYPASQVEVDYYKTPAYNLIWGGQTWQNLILTIPGKVYPEQVVIMSAHFDSTGGYYVKGEPYRPSPGADDNASGSASLLEAARLLHNLPLDRTVKLIWFTGEEQGLWGSGGYVHDHDLSGVVGVVNLDMFANDTDNDRCFEIHASWGPTADSYAASNAVGRCMVHAVNDYKLNLTYDYLSTGATGSSDHAWFWSMGIGAIEVGENFENNNIPGGCTGADKSAHYHQSTDTFDNINLPFALDIHKAALATVIDLANGYSIPLYLPLLTNNP